MATRTLRRRIHHGDVDGRKTEQTHFSRSDSLNEPLLQDSSYDDRGSEEYQDIYDDKKECLHWSFLFTQLISQWAQWIANIIIGSGSIFGRFLTLPAVSLNGLENKNAFVTLSSSQEESLRNLRRRLQVPFDGSRMEHQEALKQLWMLAYPGRELPPMKSELWKEMGWQGVDPATDFRGGGFISLENLIYFAKNYPRSFQRLLYKKEGSRAEWEYPFAVAGINISFMLIQMLGLQSGVPTSKAGVHFAAMLAEDETAFDDLYCVAFSMMDAQWLAKRASYMEFNDILKSTREQLERELALEDLTTVADLPAFTLLNK